jgi:hypothetical protein
MLLDQGICTVYAERDVSGPGEMPRYEKDVKAQSYYAQLDFETAPRWPTEHRQETHTAARVRIMQCRSIDKNDTAMLMDFANGAEKTFRITRAFHGTDEESGMPISDLTLEAMDP